MAERESDPDQPTTEYDEDPFDPFNPIEAVQTVDREYQAIQDDDKPGAVSFTGPLGFHAYFDNSEGIDYALNSAFHAAVDKAFMELLLDPELIRDRHGEVTPDTAAQELEDQLQAFYNIRTDHPLFRQLVNEFGETLREWDEAIPDDARE